MPESSYRFYDRWDHMLGKLTARRGDTLTGHKTMVTESKGAKIDRPLVPGGVSADKKTCVLVVNLRKVHYNLSVKDFRKLELRVIPTHPVLGGVELWKSL